ncbi:MAG TPA: penicillin-binding transpeptidase domain-containing protein [Bryobacteraceae bacterium]|nr:penicillin-binding transpeptidase domain-containing protein [Bryobacteraceae bacterium]
MRNADSRTQATRRLVLLAALVVVWAILIFCRLVYLQVVSHEEYTNLAERQQQRTVSLTAPRGTIWDRNGKALAISVPVDSVCVNPLRVPDRGLAAELLAKVLSGVDAAQLRAKMDAAVEEYKQKGRAARGVGFLWVKRKISHPESEALRSLKLDWIEFRKESQRFYPDGILASHVLGTVDFEERGNSGLELKLDGDLRGKAGRARMIQDVAHRSIETTISDEAMPGKDLTVALDERIQFVVERELAAACQLYSAESGSVVVMNPHTGEVLAMASYPTFDPNLPPEPHQLKKDLSERTNHPVNVAFEPGSVFKIITVSGALETTNLTPDSPINCGNGRFSLYGRVVREAKRGYGVLSVADVIAKSSNIGAIQVALRMGKENLYKYVRLFGFGTKTGITLPGESFGSIRKPERWHPAAIASVAMGHEVSTTTIQLAQATSVIANGGVLVRPRLVLSRARPGGPQEKEPVEAPKRILKPETAITMRRIMEGVVLHGTGKGARLSGYTAGGKTGSAQIFDRVTRQYSHVYNGSFVGFAPVTNPAIVIAVTLNGVTRFGGVVAAPVFKAVATEALRILQVPKDVPEELAPDLLDPSEAMDLASADGSAPPEDLGDVEVPMMLAQAGAGGLMPIPVPSSGQAAAGAQAHGPQLPLLPVGAGAAVVPAVIAVGPKAPLFQGKTMRAVLEESLQAGVPVEVVGSGIARAQWPVPGSMLNPGQRVRVEFR